MPLIESGSGNDDTNSGGEGFKILRLVNDNQNTGSHNRQAEESKDAAIIDEPDEMEDAGCSRYSNDVMDPNAKLVVQEWSSDQEIDANLPHLHRNVYVKSVMINNRFYVFQNLSP